MNRRNPERTSGRPYQWRLPRIRPGERRAQRFHEAVVGGGAEDLLFRAEVRKERILETPIPTSAVKRALPGRTTDAPSRLPIAPLTDGPRAIIFPTEGMTRNAPFVGRTVFASRRATTRRRVGGGTACATAGSAASVTAGKPA